MDPNVLIIDQDSLPCADHAADPLAALLRKSLNVRVQQRYVNAIESKSTSDSPALVILRSSAPELELLVRSCRNRWQQSRLFALLCPNTVGTMVDLPSTLANIDDFLGCPFQEDDLFLRIRRLLQRKTPVARSDEPHSMVGKSSLFLRSLEKIQPLSLANLPVLLLGETGTGKELFARALHYRGPRHGKPFIPVNCGALPDHLFESELFGHVKGAFTDAASSKKGLIMEAEGGTLFLDEVATLSERAQIKLLRFLQDGQYRPLGSTGSIDTDIRIIAATNADLKGKVEERLFREDLYHRLNVLSLTIPPLRARPDDIPRLATYFLERYSREQGHKTPLRFTPAALEKLMGYSWPGNVRELEAIIQRLVVLHPLPVIGHEDIDIDAPYFEPGLRSGTLRDAKSMAVGGFERNYLVALLSSHRGNISRAAMAAGKDRRTLQRLLRKYGLDRCSFEPDRPPLR